MRLFRSPLVLLVVLVGCGRPVVSDTTSKSADAPVVASSDDVLTSALYQLHPENFGINSNTDKPVSLLNSWRFKKAENSGPVDQPIPADAPPGWILPDEETRLAQAKFDIGDAIHIRDAMFSHSVAGYLSDRGSDELAKVAVVVDFVCRTIALWKDDEIEIPLPPFLTFQLGRGSADDRAWICADLLRQLRLDTVVLRAKKDVKESTDNWLLGVRIDDQIYLFDMRLGLPVFGGATEKGIAIARLSEIASHPEWLAQMSVNEPYRLTAEEIHDSAVYVVTSSNFWCHRLLPLEQTLPADEICVLFDPLTNKDQSSGLLHRIAAAGGWPIDSLKLWRYPQRQSEASRHPTQESSQELQRLLMPFNVPIPFKIGDDGKPIMGSPERKLQRYRMEHLLGKFAEATSKYLSIRHLEVERNPPDLERLNRMASEDAFYWTSQCKFELGDHEGAIEQLSAYLKKYDRKGKWFFPARVLLARSYAELGDLPKAISILERTSSDDPYRLANAVRVKRWTSEQSK